MNKIYLFFYLYLILNYFIYIINGLSNEELACLDNFIKKINQTTLFNGSPNPTASNYCEKPQFVTCTSGTVTSISIIQNDESKTILNEDLACFSQLVELTLTNFKLDDNFFNTEFPKTLNIFTIQSSTFQTNQPIKIKCDNMVINYSETTPEQTIYISHFQNVSNKLNIQHFKGDVKFVNDYDQSKIITISAQFEFYGKDFPNLSNLIIPKLTFFMKDDFNITTYSYLKGYTNIKTIQLINSNPLSYPTDFHSINSNNIIEYLSITFPPFPTINPSLNFNNFKKLKTLAILNSPGFSTSSVLIPILNYPPTLETFIYTTNDLSKLPNFNDVKASIVDLSNNIINDTIVLPFKTGNIRELDLSNNPSIIGSIDSSFCEVALKLKNNGMAGSLPNCIKCHLNDNTIKGWYSGNSFDLTPESCNSLIPNMKIIGGSTYLYGSQLGFLGGSNIVSTPNINFTVDIPSVSFVSKQYSTSQIFNISFTSANSQVFTVANNPYHPTPKTIKVNTDEETVTFNGEYFTYNQSIIYISIGDQDCIPIEYTFYKIVCEIKFQNPNAVNLPVVLKVYPFTSYLTLKSNSNGAVTDITKNCVNGCSRHGNCNFDTLKCTCNGNYVGDDCSISLKQCNDPTCGNGIGICDKSTGLCNCGLYLTGDSCEKKSHWVSSIDAPGESGGKVVLNGYFNDEHVDLSVTIGGLNCEITSPPPTNETITCNIGAGQGKKDIIVKQNSVDWSRTGFFVYYNGVFRCASDCSNHGDCNSNTGICTCDDNWVGFDCSSKSNQQTNNTIDNGGATLENQDISYSISLYKLLEVDYSGTIITEHLLNNSKSWQTTILNNNSKSKKIQYNQQLNPIGSTISSNISSIFEEVSENEMRSFAGIDFQLESGSIKLTISITNYPFKSYLNSLQLLIKSNVDSDNDCDEDNQTGLESNEDNDSLNYITIKKVDKVLKGRLINRISSDGKFTSISNSVLKSNDTKGDEIIISFNLPHCIKECIIDPDFSVLVSPDFESSCKSRAWVIPVAVVVSVVGVVVIAVVAVLLYKKNRMFIQIKLKTFKERKSIR